MVQVDLLPWLVNLISNTFMINLPAEQTAQTLADLKLLHESKTMVFTNTMRLTNTFVIHRNVAQ